MSGTRESIHYQKDPPESHTKAALTPCARLKAAQLVVDQAVPVSEVVARFQCSWPTVKRWADRYRASESMQDHVLTAHRSRTSKKTAARVVGLLLWEDPVQLGAVDGPSDLFRDSVEPAVACRSSDRGIGASLRARPLWQPDLR